MNQHEPLGPGTSAERRYIEGIGFALLILVVASLAHPFEQTTLNDINLWIKPQKFAISMIIHSLSIIILARLALSAAQRASRVWRITSLAYLAALLLEMIWITLQASRGRHSHFNNSTLLEAGMYAAMGVAALMLIAVPIILVLLMRQNDLLKDRPVFRRSIILGCVMSSILTLVVASYMSSSTGHWVGESASDKSGLPLLGWSTEVGDLRVSHFFATHALQIIPLMGWLITDRMRSLHLFALFYGTVTLLTFVQAIFGIPVLAHVS